MDITPLSPAISTHSTKWALGIIILDIVLFYSLSLFAI